MVKFLLYDAPQLRSLSSGNMVVDSILIISSTVWLGHGFVTTAPISHKMVDRSVLGEDVVGHVPFHGS
jgi:hypothetical protein